MNPAASRPNDSGNLRETPYSNVREENLQLDAAVLQSVSESIAVLFPQCSALKSNPCACFFCNSNVRISSDSAVANQNVARPPPSRYIRRARYSSAPPKGPSPTMSIVPSDTAPTCSGPIDAPDDFIE